MFTLFTSLKSFFSLLPPSEQPFLLISIFPLCQTYLIHQHPYTKTEVHLTIFRNHLFCKLGKVYLLDYVHQIRDNVPYVCYPTFHPCLQTLFFSLHPAQCNFGIRPAIYRIYKATRPFKATNTSFKTLLNKTHPIDSKREMDKFFKRAILVLAHKKLALIRKVVSTCI